MTRWWRGYTHNPTADDLMAAFEARYIPEPNSGCWIWIGNYNPKRKGYGCFTMRGMGMHMIFAHRLSWQIHHGPIPQGMHVLHKCDTPLCVNPDHLFLGTNTDNVADMKSKHRQAYGERHSQAKLTKADVLAIRADKRRDPAIAADYGISAGTVSDIQLRKSWRHL